MQYCGGKFRVRKQIADIINQYTKDRPFVSLFCGSCWIESLVEAPLRICNDANYYLIEMWKAFQKGEDFYSQYLPEITKEQYLYIKDHKEENYPLTALVGFGCSYGGKWFDGYASNKRGNNYFTASINSCLSKIKTMQDVKFVSRDYQMIPLPKDAVVYCDIPYNGTTGNWGVHQFYSSVFWEYIRDISKKHIVFISEYKAPDDFTCIWEQKVNISMEHKCNTGKNIEKLFMYSEGVKI